jgi:patatin-like phospholipase/acyl hydrolase
LAKRYDVPADKQPQHKMLALDGGGIRGILTLKILARIEQVLADATGAGTKFRSNPLSHYNEQGRTDCNLQIPFWQLVRASTAAPVYFVPEVLQWDKKDPTKAFRFVDGGVTPYNNPAFLMWRMATQAPYQLNLSSGEQKMLVVSVGTGAVPQLDADVYSTSNAIQNAQNIPSAFMYGAQIDQDINCRTVGRCAYGEPIDREVGDLIPVDTAGKPIPLSTDLCRAFLYIRYNAELTSPWLNKLANWIRWTTSATCNG